MPSCNRLTHLRQQLFCWAFAYTTHVSPPKITPLLQLSKYLYPLGNNQTFDIICPLLRGHNGALLHAGTQVPRLDQTDAGVPAQRGVIIVWGAE